MQKWEYFSINLSLYRDGVTIFAKTSFVAKLDGKNVSITEFDNYMNTLGEQGWELVSVTPITEATVGITNDIRYYFKRQKQ